MRFVKGALTKKELWIVHNMEATMKIYPCFLIAPGKVLLCSKAVFLIE